MTWASIAGAVSSVAPRHRLQLLDHRFRSGQLTEEDMHDRTQAEAQRQLIQRAGGAGNLRGDASRALPAFVIPDAYAAATPASTAQLFFG